MACPKGPRPTTLFITIVPMVLLSSWLQQSCHAQTFHYSRGWTNGKRAGSPGSALYYPSRGPSKEVAPWDLDSQQVRTNFDGLQVRNNGESNMDAVLGEEAFASSRGNDNKKQVEKFCAAALIRCQAKLHTLENLIGTTSRLNTRSINSATSSNEQDTNIGEGLEKSMDGNEKADGS